MTVKNNEKIYSIIAGCCFALTGLISVYNYTKTMKILDMPFFSSVFYSTYISYAMYFVLAAAMFLSQKKIVLVGVSGAYAAWRLYSFISYIIAKAESGTFNSFIFFAAAAALFVTVFLAYKRNDIAQKIWFIGAALLLIAYFIGWIKGGYFSELKVYFKYMAENLVVVAGFVFAGLWAKESFVLPQKVLAATGDFAPQYATQNNSFTPSAQQQNAAASSITGGAAKLKKYKELLDAGILTQEEFDEKKKQILGL